MIQEFKTIYVDTLPLKEDMEKGIVYISEKTWQSSHLCPCDHGEEIITPLIRGGWSYYVDSADKVTLSPSIYSEACDVSYEITKGYAII